MYISFLLPYNIRHTKAPFLWIFYKQLSSFQIDQVHYIANKDYFNSPKKYYDRDELSYPLLQRYNYEIPTQKTMDNLNKTIIPDSIFNLLQSKYSSYMQIYRYLLTTRYAPLERELDKIILSLISNNTIDAILSWCNMPSLQAVANKYNLKIIYNELGPIRKGEVFSIDLSYFDFCGVNGMTEAKNRYFRHKNNNTKNILSNEEILTLIVQDDYLPDVLKEVKPTYEVGIVLQVEDDSNILAYSNGLNNYDLISIVRNNFKKEDILIRPHPGGHLQYNNLGVIDDSKTSIEFIKKCKRIVTINSSVAIESILLNKPTYILGDSPLSFLAYNQFDIKLEKFPIEDIQEKLNFIIFNYLVPNDFIFSDVYYKFRLSNPTEEEICQYHKSYLSDIKQVKINPSLPMESMIFKKYINKYYLLYDEKQKFNEKMIREKEQLLQQKDKQLQQKDHQIQQKDYQLKQKDHQLQQKNEQLQQKDRQIQQLHDIAQSMRIKNRIKKLFSFSKSSVS